MKRIYTIMMAAGLLALAASCNKESVQAPVPSAPEGELVCLKAVVETPTRVNIASGTGLFSWSKGDRITLHTSAGYIDSEPLEVSSTTAAFWLDLKGADRQDFAIYPPSAAVADHATAGDLRVSLPAVYALEDLASESAPLVMVARGNTPEAESLVFRHVGGLFRLVVKDVPKGTDELTVTFDRDVTGVFTVADADTDHPTIASEAATDRNTVRFTFPALTDMRDVTLNIPVPVGVYGKITVKSWAGGMEFPCRMTVGKSDGLTVARKAAFGKDVYMPVFSVSATKKVVFSPGNLQAYTSNYGATWTWKFASTQYEFLSSNATLDGVMHISTESGARDYFRWSTKGANDYGLNNVSGSAATYYPYVNYSAGDFQDWGTLPIDGYPAGTWHTPTARLNYYFANTPGAIEQKEGRGEYEYLFEERSASTVVGLDAVGGNDQAVPNARYVKAMVCGVRAYVFFPDHFTYPEGVDKAPLINRGDSWWRAVYDAGSWAKMEEAGAVCIAVTSSGTTNYYTATYNAGDATGFGVNMLQLSYNASRIGWGRPWQNYYVRLVRDAN